MPWRKPTASGELDTYKILVSEIMLQQTQVRRVVPKYDEFIKQYSNTHALSQSLLAEVLSLWLGLGYNRRSKFLHEAAQTIEFKLRGRFPTILEELITLPGVGSNTVAAVMTYSFNAPVVFIKTNIRTVFFTTYSRRTCKL